MKFTKSPKTSYFSRLKLIGIFFKQSAIIVSIYALGEAIVWLFDSQFPGSVVGMLMLLGGLHLKWIKVDDIRLVSSLLLAYMPLFFIPAGVSVMVSYTLMQEFSLEILFIVMLSTIIVMIVTGKLVDFLVQKESK